jgi:drug/metabolite transporter (DMT)-like permease
MMSYISQFYTFIIEIIMFGEMPNLSKIFGSIVIMVGLALVLIKT